MAYVCNTNYSIEANVTSYVIIVYIIKLKRAWI